MTLAAASRLASPNVKAEKLFNDNATGAQSLLHIAAPPPNYPARVGAIAAYFALLAAVVTVGFKTPEAPVDEQQVVELAPIPDEEPPPPDEAPPLPETMEIPDVPPPALDPIAPVEEPKPVEKPKPVPKVEKPVERPKPRTDARPTPTRRDAKPRAAAAPAARAPAAPPGATLSASANAYHSCLQRAAGSMEPPVGGRVSYHATVSATGAVTSFSVTSSSNPALASLAQRIGGRCGSVPAPGRPGVLNGAISFVP